MSAPIAICRRARWPEYGQAASPVKTGLWPPPSAAKGLDRACGLAFVGHQAFDGKARLMPNQIILISRKLAYTKNLTFPTGLGY
jgi:hypothetical protein